MRGSEYGIVSTCREHDKTRAHNGSELPSSRLASLACYAEALRSLGLRVFACYALTGAIICRPTLRR